MASRLPFFEAMRHAILALIPLLLLVACHDDDSCKGTCKTTATKYDLDSRTLHAADQETFVDDDGTEYTLVRFEYGDTEECDAWGDCRYSTYCAFVVAGQEYPVLADWVTDADALFDLDPYCADDLDCELPGNDLAIFDNDDFDDWLWDTDVEDDILVDCFE